MCPTLGPKLSLLTRTHFTQSKRLWRLSPTRTPNAHFELVYLIKPTSEALIKSLATQAASRLRNHFPSTHPYRLVAAKIVESDVMSYFSSPCISLQVDLPAKRAQHLTWWLKKGQQHRSTDGVNGSTLCKYLSSDLPRPSLMSPPTLLPFHPVSPYFIARNSSSIVYITTCKDSDCPWLSISILSHLFSSSCHTSTCSWHGAIPVSSRAGL